MLRRWLNRWRLRRYKQTGFVVDRPRPPEAYPGQHAILDATEAHWRFVREQQQDPLPFWRRF